LLNPEVADKRANPALGEPFGPQSPKNSLLDFVGDFAKPQFGSFRFVTIKLNLSF